MLHEKTGKYHRPDGTGIGAGAGSGSGSGLWTGEKRRKQIGVSPLRVSGEVRTSSSYSPAQGDQEDPLNKIAEADPENFEINPETIICIKEDLKKKNCIYFQTSGILDEQQQRDVYKRLAVYRLRSHKLVKRESDKLDDVTLEKELPDFFRTAPIFRLHIDVHNYFEWLKENEDGSVDWYFDPQISKLEHFTDYQRLVLANRTHDGVGYLRWEDYRSNFTTYKMDKDYVTYCDEMSEKLKWLKSYIGIKGSDEAKWRKMETRGSQQALLMTTKFPDMTLDLAYTAYREHIWSLDYDYWFREEWDSIFFAIWKLVTLEKLMFLPALREVSIMHLAARHKESIDWALKYGTWPALESKFESCVKDIPHEARDEVAVDKIRKALLELPKKKILHQYKKRKMEIAEKIGLVQYGNGPRVLANGTM